MSMSTDTNLESLDKVDLDDEEDLSALDRGDAVEDDGAEGEDASRARDDKGRFAKKPDEKKADEKKSDEKKAEDEESGDEEGEEDEESEDDEDEESEDNEDTDKGKKGKVDNAAIRINKLKAQRDQERQAREALEARLAALEQASKKDATPPKDPIAEINAQLDDLYVQVEEARADNNLKQAAALQRQIDAANREIVKLEATQIASATTSEAQENARYDAMLDRFESEIDLINPQSDGFDRNAVKALEFHVQAYEKMGMKPTKALQTAVGLLFPNVEKPVEDKKVEDKPAKKKVDVQKAIDTQKKQPPDTSDRGTNRDDSSVKPSALSEDEWEKLPESKKAQLRGDFG